MGNNSQHIALNDPLLRAILKAVGARPVSNGYESVRLGGFSDEDIEFGVRKLSRSGLLEAKLIPGGLGEGQGERWEPSTLTDKGRETLAGLD